MWWSWKNWLWTVSTLRGCRSLERTDFEQFILWEGVVVLKGLIWTVWILRGCGGLERTDFEQFLLWEGVVVMKELIFNSFYFGRVWWSWKNWFGTVSTLRWCGGQERTDFEQFVLWDSVVVIKELILTSFYSGMVCCLGLVVWWSWKNWFWTVSTLRGCGSHEKTDFEQFLLWEGVVVMKELILISFYFERVWW